MQYYMFGNAMNLVAGQVMNMRVENSMQNCIFQHVINKMSRLIDCLMFIQVQRYFILCTCLF